MESHKVTIDSGAHSNNPIRYTIVVKFAEKMSTIVKFNDGPLKRVNNYAIYVFLRLQKLILGAFSV